MRPWQFLNVPVTDLLSEQQQRVTVSGLEARVVTLTGPDNRSVGPCGDDSGAWARWSNRRRGIRRHSLRTPRQGSAGRTSVSIMRSVVCASLTLRAPDKSDTAERLLISL